MFHGKNLLSDIDNTQPSTHCPQNVSFQSRSRNEILTEEARSVIRAVSSARIRTKEQSLPSCALSLRNVADLGLRSVSLVVTTLSEVIHLFTCVVEVQDQCPPPTCKRDTVWLSTVSRSTRGNGGRWQTPFARSLGAQCVLWRHQFWSFVDTFESRGRNRSSVSVTDHCTRH